MRRRRTWSALAVLVLLTLAGCGDPVGQRPEVATASGAWQRLPDPPLTPRTRAVVVGIDDRVLVVGGWEFLCPPTASCAYPEDPPLRDGAVYDATSATWRTAAPAPFGLLAGERSTAVVGGSAFVLSACGASPVCDGPLRLLEYDVARDRWSDHGSPPGLRYASLVAAGDRLVVLSGSDERGEKPDAVFDVGSGRWGTLPDDPLPAVFDRSGVMVGDSLVVAGSVIADLDAGRPARKPAARLDLTTRQWTSLPEAPGQGYQLFPTDRGPLLNGHFIEAPGWLLDPATWTWRSLPDQSGDEHDLRGVLDRDGATYDIPNSVGRMTVAHRLFVYDSVADDFARVSPLPEREDVHDDSSTALGRDLFVFGGARWPVDGTSGRGLGGELVGDAWLWTAPAGSPVTDR